MDRIHLVVFFIINTFVENESWQGPSFISEWHGIQSQDEHNSVLDIKHTLSELPAKVDVQIKVIVDGIDYIFTGTGSAQRDDDYAEEYGGVVYTYNELHVHLYFPYRKDGYATGGVAFTGSNTDYDGPITPVQGRHKTAYARVRAWSSSDLPPPLFSHTVHINNGDNNCYKEINHGSNRYADMVTAQVLLPNAHISDGQGALFQQDTEGNHKSFGGLIYGYDNTKVRLWVPTQRGEKNNGLVFCKCDGWGHPDPICGFSSGNVTVRGYVLSSDVVFEQSLYAGKDISSPHNVTFSSSVYSIDSSLVSVQVKQDGDNNDGFVFSGAGSAVSTGRNYGGVIYVYTNDSALLWTPKSSTGRGYMIYIGDRWGDGEMSSARKTATIIVKVFDDLHCTRPDIIPNAKYYVSSLAPGGTVTYTCAPTYTHMYGDLVRLCNGGVWGGILPSCSNINCSGTTVAPFSNACMDPGGVVHATYTINGLTVGDIATYVCDSGYMYTDGNLVRACQLFGTWSGVPPVCSAIPYIACQDPGGVTNASYSVTGLTIGSTVTYTCDLGYQYEAGYLTRTCQPDGTWDGLPPVCSVIKCVDPGEVVNATYTITGQYPGKTASYACNVLSTQKGGDSVRTCQVDGTWDGKPIVCVASAISSGGCLDPGGVANASYVISYTITGLSVGSTVTYVCDPGYQYEAGYLTRICQSDGTWDGVPPVCSVIKCGDPGEVVNATYKMTGQYPGDTTIYTCSAGSTQKGGDSVRTCQVDGTWNGQPIVCVVSGTCGYTPVFYTPDKLYKNVKKLKKELTVDTKTTSSYRRSLVCAQDERPSSTYIGSTGVLLLCGLIAVLVIPDLFMFVGHIKNLTYKYLQQNIKIY